MLGGIEREPIPNLKKMKEKLFLKQKGRCMYCGIKLDIRYFHVDHKMPVARDGSNSIGNLQLLCGPCNGRKGGSFSDGEFRRAYKLTPSRQAKNPPPRQISQQRFDKITKERAAKRTKRRRNEDNGW